MQIQDAMLFLGDLLQIGPYELEVLPTVAKVNDQESPPTTQTIPEANAPSLTSDANQCVAMDPPSSGDLATTIENRINRIEGQIEELQQHGAQAMTCESKTEEIKLAQEAIASLSRQLDCERERNETALESLVAQRDRLVHDLTDATQSANDLCRELEQFRHEHVEIDVTSELYSQRIAEVSELNAQLIAEVSDLNAQRIAEVSDLNVERIAEASDLNAERIAEASELHAKRIDEASDLHAERIAEVSAEVDRLAEKITETGQHHQQTRDQWQANHEALEQRLTDGANQVTQLEQKLDLVRRNHEDAEAQRQLQESQSEEIQESVRALKEHLQNNKINESNGWRTG